MPQLRLRRQIRLLARSEGGMALPVALFAMAASVALGSAAVVATVDVQSGAKRDTASKRAIAAAESGANVATIRTARHGAQLVSSPCLSESGGVLVSSGVEADGWCPEVTGSVGDATYAYRTSPAGEKCGEFDLCVVSTGTAGEVSRRVEMTFNESGLSGTGGEGSEEEEEGEGSGGTSEGLIGEEEIELSGNADVRVGVGTNGNLVTSGNASICGDIRVGIGKEWIDSGGSQCNGYEQTEGNLKLPPVSSFMPSDIATNNSNGRITMCDGPEEPVDCQKDGYSRKWKGTEPFDPSTRHISLNSNATLTVGGGDYWVCSLKLNGNSELVMAEGSTVRFFFDSPENCGQSPGATQISMNGNNKIAATGYQPSLESFDVPGFYLLGSTSWETTAYLSGNQGTNELILYAPRTNIGVSGNATFKGLIAGKRVTMSGNSTLESDAGFELPPELEPPSGSEEEGSEGEPSGQRLYTAQTFVECTGVATTPPNASC